MAQRMTKSALEEFHDFYDQVENTHNTESNDTHKFRDNNRQIDLVLVYRNDKNAVNADKRSIFQKNMRIEGLQLEDETSSLPDSDLIFLKVHGTYHVLAAWAEQHDMKVAYKEEDEEPGKSSHLLSYMSNKLSGRRVLKAVFREEDIELRCAEDEVFSSAERTQIVYNILQSVRYGGGPADVGLVRLQADRVYTDAYPLHDGDYVIPPSASDLDLNERQMLYKYWAGPKSYFKRQPLDLVGKYFGDEVALYFAWVGCYTHMLIPASVIGIIATSYMIFVGSYYKPYESVCTQKYTSSMLICPRCRQGYCQSYPVFANHSCGTAKMSYIFSNHGTLFTAICMAFWATTFMEVWKRQKAILAWRWDLGGFEYDREPRPEFESHVTNMRFNPVYKKLEPYLPVWNRLLRLSISWLGLVLMIMVVLAGAAAVIYYKIAIINAILMYEAQWPNDHSTYLEENSHVISIVTGAIINVVLMAIFQAIFKPLFFYLTDIEMPRTQTQYESSYSIKIFVFSFVNYYSLLFHVAFFKGKFFTSPGDDTMYWDDGGISFSRCDLAGCTYELFVQLIVFVFGRQVLSLFSELLVPMARMEWRRKRNQNLLSTTGRGLPRWEEDYHLHPASCFSLFDEVLEMVIQYGFITLFVAIIPPLPLLALLNNLFETRVDAHKMLVHKRRPIPRNVNGLNQWTGFIKVLAYLSVLTNGMVIAFATDIIPRNLYDMANDGDLTYYINSTVSLYPLVPDFRILKETVDKTEPGNNYEHCWYRARRWPPGHPHQYTHSYQHWRITAYRVGFLLIFVCFVFAFTALLGYLIPDIPWVVKDRMTHERQETLSAKKTMLQGARYKRRRSTLVSMGTRSVTPSRLTYMSRSTDESDDDQPPPKLFPNFQM